MTDIPQLLEAAERATPTPWAKRARIFPMGTPYIENQAGRVLRAESYGNSDADLLFVELSVNNSVALAKEVLELRAEVERLKARTGHDGPLEDDTPYITEECSAMTEPIDHAAEHALERAEYWKGNLSELGLLSRAYIALHAENELLRRVAEAAEQYRKFLPDVGYGVALKFSEQAQKSTVLLEALTLLRQACAK